MSRTRVAYLGPEASFAHQAVDLVRSIPTPFDTAPRYRVTVERHHESGGRPFSFQSAEYEAVQLLPLLRDQFVLAGRALMTSATPDPGHEVPVVLAPFLGSGSTLRGFSNRRFSDRNRVLLTGEYRWRP